MPEPVNLALVFSLTPQAALDYFRAKGYRGNPDGWAAVEAAAHRKAFTVARVASLDLLQDIKTAMDGAIADGTTFADFQKKVMPKMKALGWWGKDENGVQLGSPHRLATIFRTNVQTSYMEGRWQGLMDNVDNRPWIEYVAILDNRTRPGHRALNGKVFRYDDPFWTRFRPPIAWACRCRVRSLSDKDLERRGITPDQGEGNLKDYQPEAQGYRQPQAGYVDPRTGTETRTDVGWGYDRLEGWKPDPGRYDPGLRGLLVSVMQQGMSLSTSSMIGYSADMNIIELPEWGSVESALSRLSAQRPEWFPGGFKGIHAVSNANLFAGTMDGRLYFSDADQMVPGFKPATALKNALMKIGSGDALSFREEYAVETLWHEMLHGISGIQAAKIPIGKDAIEEGLIQSISRMTYAILMSQLGGEASHQRNVIKNGMAYPETARNFCEMYAQAGIGQDWLFSLAVNYGGTWVSALGEQLSVGLNIKPNRIQALFRHACEKDMTDFLKKIAVMQMNAPRSNRE